MTRHLGEDWILPGLDDLNREWFTAGSISVQSCDDCGALQHPPEEVCCSCGATQLSWRRCSGDGRVESVAVVHQAVHPALKDAVPYAVVVVSLDDAPGVNAVGNVLNRDPGQIEIGQRVRAVFEDATDAATGTALKIPQWEPLEG